MQQIIFFIQKYKFFLFFLLLELIAIFLTINNHAFHKSKFVSSANSITGGLYQKVSNLSNYLNLKNQNTDLITENIRLKNQLEYYISKTDSIINTEVIDTLVYNQKFDYQAAQIIKNDYHKKKNFITIDRGENSGVLSEMAVMNSKGVLGITETTSDNYARVQSILNINSKINARLKNSSHFGTLTWDGKDYNTVQLIDIPRQANLVIGDTIITGGKSSIFPEGILIGTVLNSNIGNTASNSINIKLFNDMTNLRNVYVVKNLEKIEIQTLEENNNE
jgi:rod shape-determining protein MreC